MIRVVALLALATTCLCAMPVSFEEYTEMCTGAQMGTDAELRKRFDALDGNADGAVDMDDVERERGAFVQRGIADAGSAGNFIDLHTKKASQARQAEHYQEMVNSLQLIADADADRIGAFYNLGLGQMKLAVFLKKQQPSMRQRVRRLLLQASDNLGVAVRKGGMKKFKTALDKVLGLIDELEGNAQDKTDVYKNEEPSFEKKAKKRGKVEPLSRANVKLRTSRKATRECPDPVDMGYEDLFHFIDDFGKNFVRPGFLDVIVPATGPPYTGLGTQHAQMGEFSQALLYFTAELYHSFSGPYWKNMAAILGDLAARRMERARKPERSGFLLLRMQLQAYNMMLVLDPWNRNEILPLANAAEESLRRTFPDECPSSVPTGQCSAGGQHDDEIMRILRTIRSSESAREEIVARWCGKNAFIDLNENEQKTRRFEMHTFRRAVAAFHVCGAIAITRCYPDSLMEDILTDHNVRFEDKLEQMRLDPSIVNSTEAAQRSVKRYEFRNPMKDPFTRPELPTNSFIVHILNQQMGERVELDTFSSVTSMPNCPVQHWHRDVPNLFSGKGGYHKTDPPFGIVNFVALTDVTEDMGPTDMYFGSHVQQSEFKKGDNDEIIDDRRIVPMAAPKGSAVLFDLRMLHRGGENVSNKRRPMLYMAYVKEWYTDAINFNLKQTHTMDSLENDQVRKALSRVDHRAYVEQLEKKLLELGVEVKSTIESSYNYHAEKLAIVPSRLKRAGEI